MERQGHHRLTSECRFGRKRQKCYFVLAGEGIGIGKENGHIVLWIRGDDRSLNELRRTVRPADENVGLAAIAEIPHDVRDRKEVALFVNEEAIAKETVVVATRGWRSVKLINDGANSGGERGIVGRVLGNRLYCDAAEEAEKRGYQPGNAGSIVCTHSWQKLLQAFPNHNHQGSNALRRGEGQKKDRRNKA